MSIIEHIISIIAPNGCLACRAEGHVLCAVCAEKLPSAPTLTDVIPGRLVAATPYEGSAKKIVHALKFEQLRAAAEDIADIMVRRLPVSCTATVVTYVPTATSRVRQRGYDQSRLIAEGVARRLGLPCRPLLFRYGQARQVGQTKNVRMRQLEQAFGARGVKAGERILLVDDVLTTGSTMRAAAMALHRAGAERVDAAVFALAARDLE